MKSQLVLYTNPRSRGNIAIWMLEELGMPYERKEIEFKDLKNESYLKINPMGKVPTLVHNDHIVTEVAAICTYLAESFPEKKLGPTAQNRASYYRWLFFAAGPLEAAITNKSLGVSISKEQQSFVGYGNYDLTIGTLASVLSQAPYIAGDQFTAADVYVGSQVGFALTFKTLPDLPEFRTYWERLCQREAYKRARPLGFG